MKKLVWLADSRAKLKLLPAGVQDDFGYACTPRNWAEPARRLNPFMVWEAA